MSTTHDLIHCLKLVTNILDKIRLGGMGFGPDDLKLMREVSKKAHDVIEKALKHPNSAQK